MIKNRVLRIFFLIMIISLAVLIVSTLLHNYISGILKTEEPVFFFIAVFLAPIGLLGGGIGTIVVGIKELISMRQTKVRPVKTKKVKRK